MERPKVVVAKGEDPYETTRSLLEGYPIPDLREKRVLIKPNAARVASPGQGITTDPRVVEAVVDHLRKLGPKEILIGESCIFGVKAEDAFSKTGFLDLGKRLGIEILDLDRFGFIEIPVPRGLLLERIKVSALVDEVDFIVSVPVMKTHMHTGVSLSIKNMKGLLWRREKARLHHLSPKKSQIGRYKALDVAIAEMATVLFPDFAVVDGTFGMEGMGPAYGKPKPMGVIVIGSNALSTDSVSARLMGLRPSGIAHLRLSFLKGLGEISLKRIQVEPRDFLKFSSPFELPPENFSFFFPDLVIHERGSCSACLSTLMVFLKNYRDSLDDYRLEDSKVHLGVGKYLEDVPQGTILIGNCTSKLREKGIFVEGCPPVASQILEILSSVGKTRT